MERFRFAPSPTGYLHVGGARTALFNWLAARTGGGRFLLRIEDTDRERSSEEMVEAILAGMRWLGLEWDEEILFQSTGVDRHRAAALRLLAEGKAYRDFSDPEELHRTAAEQGIGHPSQLARERAEAMSSGESEERGRRGEPFAIRLRVPEGSTEWDDLVHGRVSFGNRDVDDLVILRSDGTPIYNLAVVSDDAHQGITHVLRGDDHLSNTPKQILLYRALGLPEPVFGHVPMILGPDGKRLSKRHGATAVGEYAGQGILPDAMVNFLALLGWSPGDDTEVMDRAELLRRFTLDRVHRKSAVFDPRKLEWLNGQHLARLPRAVVLEQLDGFLDPGELGHASLVPLLELLQPRSRTIRELALQLRRYLNDPVDRDPDAVAKHWSDPAAVRVLLLAQYDALASLPVWDEASLEGVIRSLAEERNLGLGKAIHPLRVAVTGSAASPGMFEVLVALGRDRSLGRLEEACAVLGAGGGESA